MADGASQEAPRPRGVALVAGSTARVTRRAAHGAIAERAAHGSASPRRAARRLAGAAAFPVRTDDRRQLAQRRQRPRFRGHCYCRQQCEEDQQQRRAGRRSRWSRRLRQRHCYLVCGATSRAPLLPFDSPSRTHPHPFPRLSLLCRHYYCCYYCCSCYWRARLGALYDVFLRSLTSIAFSRHAPSSHSSDVITACGRTCRALRPYRTSVAAGSPRLVRGGGRGLRRTCPHRTQGPCSHGRNLHRHRRRWRVRQRPPRPRHATENAHAQGQQQQQQQ